MIYDIAFSLNRSMKIKADSFEEAEQKIKETLTQEGIDLENRYTYEEYDVSEEDEE